MKKHFLTLAAAILSLGTFMACEDVPAPFELNITEETSAKEPPYAETFTTSLGGFRNYTTDGSGAWTIDYKTAKASGWDGSATTAGTYYLVSPAITLENVTSAHITYEYILRYNKADDNQQLLITTSFDEENPAEGWTLLNQAHTEGSDWDTFASADVSVPAEFIGKVVRIALRYNTNATSGSTWEVKNFCIAEGEGGGTETPDTPDEDPVVPSGDNLLENGDFETWTDGLPNNWKSASTAGNATLSQSTDAHNGAYSVEVTGTSSANKRLAYKEITLAAGTYTMTYYAKAATSTGGSTCPGYVPVIDGSVGSKYMYKEENSKYVYYDLTSSAWTLVDYTFTLSEETTLCLVAMNSKNPGGNILIDDMSLVATEGGGEVSGGDNGGTTTGGTIFSETFASGMGNFTTDDVELGTLSYVWKADTSYGYVKASAYAGGAVAAESWLISPVIDLTSHNNATLTFSHAANFFNDVDTFKGACSVKIRTEGGSWTDLAYTGYPAGNSWTFTDASASLAAYGGNKVQIAFRYTSTSSVAGSWEIKNFLVAE